MTIEDKNSGEKRQYDINRVYQHYQQIKLINMNILLEKKYCLLVKLEL